MKKGLVKKRLDKHNFYLSILRELETDTNLTRIKEKLDISKQQLNYYLRELKKKGFVFSKGQGWWELTEKGKNPTKYSIFLKEDSIRGHAYVWEIEIEKIPDKWNERIEILKKFGINYVLVGALKNVPRIKVLGRKVWLCNDHLRIYDTEKSSYYGETAQESQVNSKEMALKILHACENKIGIKLNPEKIKFRKEHYALIKNALAIDQNQKGIIWRIKDGEGEWLLIDDSLGEGGELENIGKGAFKTNPKLQNYWNDLKKHNFEVNSSFILNGFNQLTQSLNYHAENMTSHVKAVQQLGNSAEASSKSTEFLAEAVKEMKESFEGEIKLLREEIKKLSKK